MRDRLHSCQPICPVRKGIFGRTMSITHQCPTHPPECNKHISARPQQPPGQRREATGQLAPGRSRPRATTQRGQPPARAPMERRIAGRGLGDTGITNNETQLRIEHQQANNPWLTAKHPQNTMCRSREMVSCQGALGFSCASALNFRKVVFVGLGI